jgi:hypothetical protein
MKLHLVLSLVLYCTVQHAFPNGRSCTELLPYIGLFRCLISMELHIMHLDNLDLHVDRPRLPHHENVSKSRIPCYFVDVCINVFFLKVTER